DKLDLAAILSRKNYPALYAAAAAQAGMADVSASLARHTRESREQARLWAEAASLYQKSLDTFHQIPQPGRFSTSQFPIINLSDVPRKLAECNAKVQQFRS